MSHPDDDLLRRYKSGSLAPHESEQLEDHLAECDHCGERFDDLDHQNDALVGLLRGNLHDTLDRPASAEPDSTGPNAPARSSTDANAIPHYTQLERLGHGGMGVVYKALDRRVKREVALKIISPDREWRPEFRGRFHTEAQSAARLQHPNIVQLFEFGEHEGVLFCVFEYVDGGTLSGQLRERPINNRDAAELVATLADAVHFAHQRSIIHRDLKPDNVLMTRDGIPKVADFGLAKRLDVEDSKTITGMPMGTPAYMSPEQADGTGEVTTAADIYSLGAILYECLVGRPLFEGSVLTILDQVRRAEPTRPSKLDPNIDRDLEAICLRCLHKDPEKRFSSAADLADDLKRYLTHVPVLSRPPSLWDRGWKTAQRNPTAATFGSLFLASIIIGFPIVVALNFGLRRRQAELNVALDESNRSQFALQLQRVLEIAPKDPGRALAYLQDESICRPELRDLFWSYLFKYCSEIRSILPEVENVTSIALSPDQSLAALGTERGALRLFRSSENNWVAVNSAEGHTELITQIDFSGDGQQLATASQDNRVIVWDVASMTRTATLTVASAENFDCDANGVKFLDNERLITAHSDGVLRIWNLSESPPVPVKHAVASESILNFAVNADGTRVAVCTKPSELGDGRSTPDQREFSGGIQILSTGDWTTLHHAPDQQSTFLAFHTRDARTLYSTGSQRQLTRWINSETQLSPATQVGKFEDKGSCVAVSPDGSLVAAGSYDGTIHVWDEQCRERIFLAQCGDQVRSLTFLDSGRLLVGCRDSPAQIWNTRQSLAPEPLIDADNDSVAGSVQVAAVSPQSGHLLCRDSSGQLTVWDPHTAQPLHRWSDPEGMPLYAVTMADTGALIWAAGENLYRCESLHQVDAAKRIGDDISTLALVSTPHGVAVANTEYQLLLVDPNADRTTKWEIELNVRQLCYAAGCDRLIALLDDFDPTGGSIVWIGDPQTGSGTSLTLPEDVAALAASHRSDHFAIATRNGTVMVLDQSGHVLRKSSEQRNAYPSALAFTQDDSLLISLDEQGQLRFWDPLPATGIIERGALAINQGRPTSLVLDENHSRLYIGFVDGAVRVMDWQLDSQRHSPLGL